MRARWYAAAVLALATAFATARVLAQQVELECGCGNGDLRAAPINAHDLLPPTFSGFAVVPETTEEVGKVFGTSETVPVGARRDFADLRKKFGKSPGMHVATDPMAGPQALLDFIANDPAQFKFIVGHNDNGKLVFLDGSHMSLEAIGDLCYTHGRICVFLSCDSDQYVTRAPSATVRKRITFHDAVDVVGLVSKVLDEAGKGGKKVALSEVQDAVDRALEQEGVQAQTSRLIVKKTNGGPILVGVVLEDKVSRLGRLKMVLDDLERDAGVPRR